MTISFNQINIEKVENGFVISKQTVAKNMFGSKAVRFSPYVAKDVNDLKGIIEEMVVDIESALDIEKELQSKEKELEQEED